MDSNIGTPKMSQKKRYFYIWLLLLGIWLLYILVPSIFREKISFYIFDPNDYSDYYYGGRWIHSSEPPLTEYPQIPTYLFGLNRFISDSFSSDLQYGVFYAVFSLEMITILFFVIKILDELPSAKVQGFFIINALAANPLFCIKSV